MTGDLTRAGYAWVRGAFEPAVVAAMRTAVEAALASAGNDPAVLANDGPAYGARDLLRLWPEAVEYVRRSSLVNALIDALGPNAGVVRGLYFDKPPGHSWALPWHKDSTIAVRRHLDSDRFTKPTRKAGVPHVEASADLLDRMLTARIHLDDVTDDNGPLRVAPGSHSGDEARPPRTLHCRAGDVLLMRPQLSHASGHSTGSGHRRIVHLECTADGTLPDGFEWHRFVPLRV